MIDQLLKETGSLLLVPLAMIIAGLYLVKGAYGLHRSRSQDRKDFLDLWARADKSDDLWLQVAVRHVYGENLPSSLIRHLIGQPQAARGLSELAFAWPLLDMDDASGQLRWRNSRHFSSPIRYLEQNAWFAGYWILGLLSLFSVFLGVHGGSKSALGITGWVLAVEAGLLAYFSLIRCERLRNANLAVPRWTAKLLPTQGDHEAPRSKPQLRTRKKR